MPTVLVVDDSSADREIVERLLAHDPSLRCDLAFHGGEALAKISAALPDLVLTDLRMPEVNGLELVTAVRNQYPQLPVILMTAHGSEEIAVAALRRGATSYVSKTQLKELLLSTVNEVLAIARAGRSHQRLIECVTRTEFEFQLDNDPQLVPAIVDLLQQMLAGVQLCDANGRIRIAVALEEAILNALYHGNLEISRDEMYALAAGGELPVTALADLRRSQPPYRDRKIHVSAHIGTTSARFVIRDEGPGFDSTRIPDPRDVGNVERSAGRGLMLMQMFMDEVRFNPAGNEVTMEVFVLKPDAPPIAETPTPASETLFQLTICDDALVIVPLRGISSFAEDEVQREFSDILVRIKDSDLQGAIIDFSNMSYFGSNMLEAIRIINSELRTHDRHVAVCGLSPVAKEILQLARFDQFLAICEDRSEAQKRLRTDKPLTKPAAVEA